MSRTKYHGPVNYHGQGNYRGHVNTRVKRAQLSISIGFRKSLTAYADAVIIRPMANLGEIIKQKRLARNWSLKKLGTEIGVTAAYVGDLEANRRLPSADLIQRLSLALDIPPSELAAVDSRLSPDLREWIEERPDLISLLRSLRSSTQADMFIQRFARFLKRRQPPQPARGFLVIWESEL